MRLCILCYPLVSGIDFFGPYPFKRRNQTIVFGSSTAFNMSFIRILRGDFRIPGRILHDIYYDKCSAPQTAFS